MKGKKILFISSEVVPYMPQSEISTLTYNLPKLVNENGGQTRIFIPKYGNINERRHQLHEVIRLSGINLSQFKNLNLAIQTCQILMAHIKETISTLRYVTVEK